MAGDLETLKGDNLTVTLKPETEGVAVAVRVGRSEGVIAVKPDKRAARSLGRSIVACEALPGFRAWLASGGAGALSDVF